MIGWLVFGLIALVGFVLSIIAHDRWGRGAHSAMSPEMEAEAANYVNYGRGPHVS
jgi:hypothetical protein